MTPHLIVSRRQSALAFLVGVCVLLANIQPVAAQQPAAPLTLADTLARARANEPTFAAAVAAAKTAALDRSIARAALLPQAAYHNQFIYTQGAGLATNRLLTANPTATGTSTPRYIANNAIHEYVSQGTVTETLGGQQVNAVSRATASAAIATAELEIARRGLTATVAGLFYGSLAATRKVGVAQRAATEAADFTRQTSQREQAREVAHADVLKAQLLEQQRTRDLADAKLTADRARLDLAVLLFPDPRAAYTLAPADTPPTPPDRAAIEAALAQRNPELQSALASSRLADLGVTAARLAYLPDLSLNFTYGIDAAQFATRGPDGSRNLGYSAFATLDIPVWDWFTTHNRVRQSQIQRHTARVVLSNTQRRLLADVETSLAEASVAHEQLESLDLSARTAAESLRLVRLRYTSGEATVLEVVDAQTSLTIAENAREDGTTRYQTALANLQLLTGTL